jgi:hypothetical protein
VRGKIRKQKIERRTGSLLNLSLTLELNFIMENNNKRLQTDESKFLRGPLSRFKELFFTFRVMFSFIKAFRKMHFIGP